VQARALEGVQNGLPHYVVIHLYGLLKSQISGLPSLSFSSLFHLHSNLKLKLKHSLYTQSTKQHISPHHSYTAIMIEVPKAESLKELFSLKGKVVVVTGASGPRGMGYVQTLQPSQPAPIAVNRHQWPEDEDHANPALVSKLLVAVPRWELM